MSKSNIKFDIVLSSVGVVGVVDFVGVGVGVGGVETLLEPHHGARFLLVLLWSCC